MKETYEQFNARIQSEVDALPMHFAFSQKQFDELCKKLSISEDEVSEKLMRGPYGCFYLKSDAELIATTFRRHSEELETAMSDIDFFKEAIIYEMKNHEYHINGQGDYDVCNALGLICEYEYGDIRDIENTGMTDEQKVAYKEARSEFLKMADENGWY